MIVKNGMKLGIIIAIFESEEAIIRETEINVEEDVGILRIIEMKTVSVIIET